ncbi:winged helix-turn-helix domain-containing protein [Colwellia sp. MB3u-4]|uniref:winged helix-turn-helix domain-containing protein n=1 Tax=Colwellia sp. MB3u-4 TaxID=2759822 RepID=UPI0015F37103|nr:winged helix-turn-helix domain-containing protein [Colwellia sp. MB3u-4]MBA6289748.1 winged helix-turn-helix transcriptional regulator [Colwellia sp. MB3u-4]
MELPKLYNTGEACSDYCSKCKSFDFSNCSPEFQFDLNNQIVSFKNEKAKLSKRGFRLLCAFIRFKDIPLSVEFLHDYGWPDQLVVKNNLAVTISEMRTNLRHTNLRIENIRGFGYLLSSVVNEGEHTSDSTYE